MHFFSVNVPSGSKHDVGGGGIVRVAALPTTLVGPTPVLDLVVQSPRFPRSSLRQGLRVSHAQKPRVGFV